MSGYTLHNLLHAMAYCKAHPDARIATGEWTHPQMSGAEWRAWFRDCLDSKINRADPRARYRKMQYEYQQAQRNDARMIHAYLFERIRSYGSGILCTPELQARYPHINKQLSED